MGPVSFDKLKKNYLKAFVLIIVFATFSQVLLQSYIYFQKPNAEIINVAGKQRMLSQRISRLSLQMTQASAEERTLLSQSLRKSVDLFSRSHAFLKVKVDEFSWLSHFYPETLAKLKKLDPLQMIIKSDAQCFIESSCQNDTQQSTTLVTNADRFLVEMDKIVKHIEIHSREQVIYLALIEIGLFFLTLMILLYEIAVVVLPTNRLVAKQMQDLEAKHQAFLEQQAMAIHGAKLSTFGEVAAGVGHEINNPLTILLAYTDRLKNQLRRNKTDHEAIPIQLDLVSKIEHCGKRISTIVASLQKFTGRQDSQLKEINVSHLIQDTVDSMGMLGEDFKTRVELLCGQASETSVIYSDEGKLRQILMNLVKNAIDSLHNKANGAVQLNCLPQDEGVQITVADNGPGIPLEIRDKVFKPFFTTKGPQQGSGLGLAITKQLVDDCGGTIDFSTSRSGTTFTLSFPKEPQAPAPKVS